jgi:hypothetical protein
MTTLFLIGLLQIVVSANWLAHDISLTVSVAISACMDLDLSQKNSGFATANRLFS